MEEDSDAGMSTESLEAKIWLRRFNSNMDFFLENWRLLQLGVKHIKTYKSYGNFRLHG